MIDFESELKKICDQLYINYSDEMLNFYKDKLTIKNAIKIENWSNLSKPVIKNNYNKFKDELNDWEDQKKINNIVYMGMGEPFYNFDNIKKSVEILKND